MILLAIALQAAATPQTRSVLLPEPTERCTPSKGENADIVVCDGTAQTQKLPLHEQEPGATPHGVNPTMTGAGALASTGTPCAATQGGCMVGFGPPIAPILKGAVGLVKSAFAKRPDKSNRVPIPLDEPAAPGHIVLPTEQPPAAAPPPPTTPALSTTPAKAGAQ